jgi:glycerol kinase
MKASLLGASMHRASSPSPAAHGAALFAAACLGWFPSVADASAAWIRSSATFEPR